MMGVWRIFVYLFVASPLLTQQSELSSNGSVAQDGLLEGPQEPVERESAASAAHEFINRARRRGAPKHDLEKLSELVLAAEESCKETTDGALSAVWEAELRLAVQLLRQADLWTRTYVSLWLLAGEAEAKPAGSEAASKSINVDAKPATEGKAGAAAVAQGPGASTEDGGGPHERVKTQEKEFAEWAQGEATLERISRQALQTFEDSPNSLSPAAASNLHTFLIRQHQAFAYRAAHVGDALELIRQQAELRRQKVHLRGSLLRAGTPEIKLLSSKLGLLRQNAAREAHKASHYAFVCSQDGSLPAFVYHLLRSNGGLRVYED